MSLQTRCVAIAVGLAAFSAASLYAHVDDPKERDKQPPYVGPGYKSGQDGAAGGPPIDFASNNVNLLSWLTLGDFDPSNTSAATVEAYVSPSGREYAVVGLSNGTGFAEVTDPTNAVVVGFIPGPTSLWKDVRVYQQHAYSVSEAQAGNGGIQVMNLTQIDSGIVTVVGTFNPPIGNPPTATTARTHTMFINQASGRLYRAGGEQNGLRIYSLANPASPVYLGSWPDRYVHEVTVVTYTSGPYAGREIAFCCGGFNGGQVDTGLYIVDVGLLLDGNPLTEPLLSFHQYGSPSFSHQGWLSENKQYFFLNDELDNNPQTRIIDVSDLSAPTSHGGFSASSGGPAIDHNLYVRGSLIFEANYRSGLHVFDATNPLWPVEIAFFDTYPADNNANFNGLWDCDPFLPSGVILGSDIEKGLFVWSVGPAGIAIELPDGVPALLNDSGDSIDVMITEDGGSLESGSAKLRYRVGGGGGAFVESDLVAVGKNLYEARFPALPCGAEIEFYISAQTTTGVLVRNPESAPQQNYSSRVAQSEITGVLHDMETDSGWVVGSASDNAATGIWTRVDPNGTSAQPENDNTPGGTMCWVTGQGPVGGGAGDADVDGPPNSDGITTLTSPTLNATLQPNAYVEYYRWYSNNAGASPGLDSMPVEISSNNGANWTQLELVNENEGAWVRRSFRISDFVAPTAQVKLRFIARDILPGSLIEAGVDDVRIVYYDCGNPADLNGDGVVNVSDLLFVISNWGACPAPPAGCPADVAPQPSGNGVVNVSDLLFVIQNWGS